MPTLALYDAFIQQLANKLVPTPSPKVQERDDVRKERDATPNPLSMEPKPSGKDEKQDKTSEKEDNSTKTTKAEDKSQEVFNPSLLSMTPWKK